MTLRDLFLYGFYGVACLLVSLPYYLLGVSLHQYANLTFTPVHDVAQGMSAAGDRLSTYWSSRSQMQDQLETLRRDKQLLREQNQSLRLMYRRYERLRADVNLPPDSTPARVIPAEVRETRLFQLERTVELNRGRRDGISEGVPVLYSEGDTWVLYGQVQDVFPERSRLITTADPRFKVGVVIDGIPNRQFVARGNGDRGLRISHFPRILEVNPEASVRTAPTSTVAPDDLLVGTVERLSATSNRDRRGNVLRVRPAISGEIPAVLWVVTEP